jgi:hypothetical protein
MLLIFVRYDFLSFAYIRMGVLFNHQQGIYIAAQESSRCFHRRCRLIVGNFIMNVPCSP